MIESFVVNSENVRLGDYDLNLSKNCVGRNCGNPMRINEIDRTIPHESFNHRAINRKHDIGLVRLKRSVQYTSKNLIDCLKLFTQVFWILGVVRPVCLPTPSFPPMRSGESVYVVGFGRTLQSKTSSIKQKLRLPIYDHTKCKQKFAAKNVDVTEGQICAGGEFSRDACDGGKSKLIKLLQIFINVCFRLTDSGGPLMRFKDNWIAEGIVSFGYLCGLQDWPAIYTKVSSYTEWIDKHIEP